MSIFATPELWVLVSFLGFVGLLVYLRVPQWVAAALDKRADTIRKELEEARRLRDEAQAILADYDRKQRDAEKEAQDIVRLARVESEAFAEETRAALEESLRRRTRIAEEKIGRAEAQALAEVRAAAVEVAVAAAEALIRDKLTADTAAKLVDDGIASVETKLN